MGGALGVDVVNYMNRYSSVELTFHSWDKTYLVMMYYIFYIVLDSIYKYFVKDFCIYVYGFHLP